MSHETHPGLHRVMRATPDAVAVARHAVAAFACDHGASARRASDIALAVSEACTNAVVHAYLDHDEPGTVEVDASRREGSLAVRVADHGRGLRPRPDSPGPGLGLPLIHVLSDECVLADGDPGTVVDLRFAIPQPV
ncbi:MAG TPA: ATP-binding protein [Solirubrobacteraceae bacterium]|nr:ATP-binding protein [Solirubrobacteraceae bacterium]